MHLFSVEFTARKYSRYICYQRKQTTFTATCCLFSQILPFSPQHGVTKCQRKQCPLLTCSNITRTEGSCCPECLGKHTLLTF